MLSRIQSRKASSRVFFEAVEQNNTSGLIDLVLSTRCDPRYIRNEQQQSLLHVACQLNCNGVIDMIRVLVEIYQCTPLLTDQNSLTAYEYACFSGNVEVLAYLFRNSDHHFITNYQPPPQSFNIFNPSHSEMLITAASQSGSIEMLRFAYSIFEHINYGKSTQDVFSLKYSLYKDKLAIVCKAVSCQQGTKHTIYGWPKIEVYLYEACCGGNLDTVTFLLDELTIEKHSFSGPTLKSKGREKQVYVSLLEIACRLNKCDIADYLTTSKGIGPVQAQSSIHYNDTYVHTADTLCNLSTFRNIDTCSPLHMAVRSGNIEIVKGFTVYQHHLYGDTDTLLHSACVSGKKDMVKLVIDKFACSTNVCNIDGDTPLHVACEWGHLDICLLLLEQEGCNIDATNGRRHTPLSLAVRHNRFEIFQILLNKGANICTKTKDTHETPLHFACSCVDSQFALALLENRACGLEYLNAADKYGDTALFNACRIRSVILVKTLISKLECVRSFINGDTDEMAAHIACRMNSLDILKVLVSGGLDSPMQCCQTNYLEKSLLHLACENDAEDIVDYLVDNKICEQNNLDCNGWSPLHIAYMRGNTRIVKKLLTSEKFKLTDKDKEENTVLHHICNRDVIDPELILCLKSEVSSMILEPNLSEFNPLHYLCANDGMQILFCLLKHSNSHEAFNVALNAPNGDTGDTPLHLAFHEQRLMIIKFLFNCCEMSDGLSKAICVQNSKNMNNVFHCAIDYMHSSLYNTDGRKTSTSFAVTVIDLLLRTVNSNIQEENIVLSLCQKNNDQYTPIQYLITKARHSDEQSIVLSILSSLWDSKLSPDSKRRIFSVTTTGGNTLIHMAVEMCCFDIIKFLVDKKICTLTTCNEKGESPLHVACSSHYGHDTEIGVWLCEHGCDVNQENKEGNTPLHVACAARNKGMVTLLLENDKCKSLNLRNAKGHTPIHYALDLDLIKHLIINGADSTDVANDASVEHMMERLTKLKDENPLNPTATVLVLGNSEAGKTTFIKSITEAYSWEKNQQPSIGQIQPMEEKDGSTCTAGIKITEYRIFEDDVVRILFYDFAGHPEFESTHSVLLQNLLSISSDSEPSGFLFLIIVDVTKPDKLTQVMYWAKFIENCESSFAMGKPEIVIVGSHVDIVLKDASSQEAEKICKSVKNSLTTTVKSISLEIIENPFLINCCRPKVFDLQKVKKLLSISTKRLGERVRLDIGSHLLFVYLHVHFGDKPVKLSVLQKSLKEKMLSNFDFNELSFTRNTLIDLLKGMHYRQHILLIGLEPDLPEVDFWILTTKAQSLMFQEINGLLFSSNKLDRYIKIDSNVGVLPSSVLKKEFPDLEYDLLQQFLEYSELCKKIDDTEILDLIENRSNNSSGQHEKSSSNTRAHQTMTISTSDQQCEEHIEYLFFPGLIKGTGDKYVWKPNDDYSYTAGWSLECVENSFFNALFLQVLLLRLVFHFAATSSTDNMLNRESIIWKNGVFWSIEEVEILVEVVNQNQVVNVLVRCFEDTELEAVKLRSAVLKEVFKVKEKHCPKTEVIEYIIRDPNFNDHGASFKHVQKVAMKEIVSAIIKGSPRVQDTLLQHHAINKSLLCFEPYTGIGDELLTSLFDFDKAIETVPEDFLSRVVDLQNQAGARARHTDLMMRQVNKSITYRDVRKLFDMYSVFHGRNPKVNV